MTIEAEPPNRPGRTDLPAIREPEHLCPAVKASVGDPCRFHDMRHTHAALLVAVNTHPKLLQSRLGHNSIKTTLDIHGHLDEPLDEVGARVCVRWR